MPRVCYCEQWQGMTGHVHTPVLSFCFSRAITLEMARCSRVRTLLMAKQIAEPRKERNQKVPRGEGTKGIRSSAGVLFTAAKHNMKREGQRRSEDGGEESQGGGRGG